MDEITIVTKILGCVCVLAGCFLCGQNMCLGYEHKYNEYEGLKLVLQTLLRNQNYLRQPFPELFKECGEHLDRSNQSPSFVARETKTLGMNIPVTAFETAWEEYVLNLSGNLKLGEGLKHQLLRMGTVLQGMDKDGLEGCIRATLELLQEDICYQRSELRNKKKVSMACCMMVGILTVILLL